MPRSLLEQRFRALNGSEARPSRSFERQVAARHARATKMCEKTMSVRCFQVLSKKNEPARAVVPSAQWLQSTTEQYFERPMAAEHARAVISSAMCGKAEPALRRKMQPTVSVQSNGQIEREI